MVFIIESSRVEEASLINARLNLIGVDTRMTYETVSLSGCLRTRLLSDPLAAPSIFLRDIKF